MATLSDHIARIAQDEALPQRVEEAARQTAVLPVLDALGWDCWDGNEVTPEFEVRGGRVDYCLQVPGRRLVLIEVKRTGTDLTGHQEQLLRYAFEEGVPLAALTDGRVWWLYLSTAAGNWEQRRFYTIDFEVGAASAAADLQRFLGREGVTNGNALREAQREFESRERDRSVRAALQRAWRQVLEDPDGLLRELLAEEVREITGHQPEPITIAEFLKDRLGMGTAQAVAPASPAPAGRPPAEPERPRRLSFQGQRVAAYLLDGTRHEVRSWPHLVRALSEQLAGAAGPGFAERVAAVRGRTRVYFSVRPDDLQRPQKLANASLYVEGNLGPDPAASISRRILIAVRGSDTASALNWSGRKLTQAGRPPWRSRLREPPFPRAVPVSVRRRSCSTARATRSQVGGECWWSCVRGCLNWRGTGSKSVSRTCEGEGVLTSVRRGENSVRRFGSSEPASLSKGTLAPPGPNGSRDAR